MKKLFVLVFIYTASYNFTAQIGNWDTTFNFNGVRDVQLYNIFQNQNPTDLYAVMEHSDNKILIGSFNKVNRYRKMVAYF